MDAPQPDSQATDSAAEGSVPTEGPCRDTADCVSYDWCIDSTPPPLCSNSCTTGEGCQSDADCADAGTGFVCSTWCVCFNEGGDSGSGAQCIQGCTTDADCGPATTCTPTHHCEARPCSTDADCGANFSCATGACTAKPCTQDSDCTDSWFCVDTTADALPHDSAKACSPQLGACMNVLVP